MSALQARKLLRRKDTTAYVVYLNESERSKANIDDVLVVRQHEDVLPGFSPDRQLEVTSVFGPETHVFVFHLT